MKKILLSLISFSLISSVFAFTSEAHKKFIKGSIFDKTTAVKEASGQDSYLLAQTALDFVLENSPLIGQDRDLSALAVASILKLPKNSEVLNSRFPDITDKLVQLFNLFEDENVRISVLDKIEAVTDEQELSKAVSLMNGYLKNLTPDASKSAVTGKVISCLSSTGNSESFYLIYNGWTNKSYPSFTAQTEKSLLALSVSHKSDAIKIISTSKIKEIGDYFNLIKNNTEISKEFKAEIAENVLSAAIHITEDKSGNAGEAVKLQLDCVQVICDSNWTRASSLTVRYFGLAKDEYRQQLMTEEQFILVINSLTKLSSTEFAQTLSAYLAEMNRSTESSIIPAQNVVTAVIRSLGVLGDKTAFDNLLYVTYLAYPEEVKNAARDSLAKLKW